MHTPSAQKPSAQTWWNLPVPPPSLTAPAPIETAMTEPMHAVPAIAFLCTAQSSYINGAVLVVDGASDCR
ncbi:hypothetical protein [Mycolicibacterium sarraceniae]|uniref:Uncharacterized protein n=1 Tax=Mycolicibacterium sarraceniae TaxID=1534348 RepID=A0A7I7SU12_9MYCO|nr:hypothetical protein [Mycolicibacterium sarraceniae]BBY60504.1 hypothetical protein MSAR_36400 [Mycolicibacterium sarraceniae]